MLRTVNWYRHEASEFRYRRIVTFLARRVVGAD